MTAQLLECPQCQAPLGIEQGRRYCQCAYCGSRFKIEQQDEERPRLLRFETLLQTAADDAVLSEAPQRLADLEIAVADAEDEVEFRRFELDQARSNYREELLRLQRAMSPVQNGTYSAGLLAAVALFATLFALRGPDRLAGLIIAILLVLTAAAFYREWQDVRRGQREDLQEAKEAIAAAKEALRQAEGQFEDVRLERELLQRLLLSTGRAAVL